MKTVTVVIGASEPGESLETCLAALAPQVDDQVEVLVCEALPSSAATRERFAWAQFIEAPGALVPMLWREGIDRATGDIVALTIAQMQPATDWVAAIRSEHHRGGAVGGAIEPGRRLRVTDWGEYFCRYARDMLPFRARENVDLPGDNAAYQREWLVRNRELYRDGFWEPDVHRKLRSDGGTCWHSPTLVVRQGRSFGWRAFVRQRLHHGRAYGHQRGVRFSRGRNLIGVLAAPVVPFLMTYRVIHEVNTRGRLRRRLLLALPMIFVFNLAWAWAEALGHLDMVLGR
jgi:hypothetical protein